MRERRATIVIFVALSSACAVYDAPDVPLTNIVTGAAGGTWYAMGSAIAEKANQEFRGHPITAVPGAGAVSNPARLGRVPGDVGMSYLPFLRAAYRGVRPYREALPNLRIVAKLTENKLHLLVAEDLGVRALGEIAERRVPARIGTGSPGSSEEYVMRLLLEAAGFDYENLRAYGGQVFLLSTGERVSAWKDRHLDIINFNINDPAPAVAELMASRPTRIWSIPHDIAAPLVDDYGYQRMTIPAGTYPRQDSAVSTIGVSAVVFTTAEVDDAVVYAVTKAIAENKPFLESVHSSFRDWDPREIPIDSGVPFHEGALRFYRERGFIDTPRP